MTDTVTSIPGLTAQAEERLVWRRLTVFGLCGASWLGLGLAMARLLAAAGGSWLHGAILVLFLAGLPWTLLGFWNSVIGFVILCLARDPVGYTNPALRATPEDAPITTRTAICVAMRHEDVAQVFARFAAMIESVDAGPGRGAFSFHILSDTSRPEIAEAEARAFAALMARYPRAGFLGYRRRPLNTGFKAGNLRNFAERAAGDHDFLIVLDADSLMSGAAIRRLVRVMQANPRLGILQTLVVGQPATSAFARIFQFGMRHGMRTHTMGIAWWQGPSGPYWGHNAIIRLAPFVAHCRLPLLPGGPPFGGQVLSHDQVEAALMRAGGFEVRVIADEFESWEENPPSLPDFVKRDLRWCQGNLQYLALLARPGFRPIGRFQLVNAVMMYLGAPFWMLMLAAGLATALLPIGTARPPFPVSTAFGLYFGMLAIGFAPRFLGVIDVLARRRERVHYGGAARLLAGLSIDAVFSLLLGPLMMVAQALFVAGLILRRRVGWDAQRRDGRTVSITEAAHGLWPQMAFGGLLAAGLIRLAPAALPWASPTIAACALAVPFACLTANAAVGRWMVRHRLCAVPEEYGMPAAAMTRPDPYAAARLLGLGPKPAGIAPPGRSG